jgi:hypothetical protein
MMAKTITEIMRELERWEYLTKEFEEGNINIELVIRPYKQVIEEDSIYVRGYPRNVACIDDLSVKNYLKSYCTAKALEAKRELKNSLKEIN